MIAVVYAGASWAMAAHAGTSHVVAAAAAQGPGLLFGLSGSGALSQAAQLLFVTSLFAAALAFHNAAWRYAFALGRENVLPAALGRTGANNIPKAASLAQSVTAVAVIAAYAISGLPPMADLFFWFGAAGGLGIIVLLTATSAAVTAFFARDPRGENTWRRLIAPALAAVLLAGIAVLAIQHYAVLLGVPPGAVVAWAFPAAYATVAVIGLGWAGVLKGRRPGVYDTIGLGAHAVTVQHTPAAPERS
jgi:amino acid transporter